VTLQELDSLIGRYLEGLATDEDVRRLLAELDASEPARVRLARQLYHEKTLIDSLSESGADAGAVIPFGAARARHKRFAFATGGRTRQIAGLIAASLLVAWLGAYVLRLRPASEPAGTVAHLDASSGMVVVRRGTGTLDVVPDMALLPGDRIRTAAGGRARCLYHDTTSIELGANTEIVIGAGRAAVREARATLETPMPGADAALRETDPSGKQILVLRGTLAATVARQPDSTSVVFASPNALTEVISTTLSLAVAPYWTRLDVREGTVRLTHARDARRVLVPARHYAVAAAGIALEPRPIPAPDPARSVFKKRYVMCQVDPQEKAETHALQRLMERAAAAGYNGLVLGDRFGRYLNLQRPSRQLLDQIDAIRRKADALGLALIPCSLEPDQVSYTDRSLTAALPVRDTPFRAQANVARAESDPAVALANPGFETAGGGQPAGWEIRQQTARIEHVRSGARSGEYAVRLRPAAGRAPAQAETQLVQRLRVKPYRAYTVSFWARASAPGTELRMRIEGAGYTTLGAVSARTGSDRYRSAEAVFNALANKNVWLDFSPAPGTRADVWLDDVALRDVGLRNTVRRDSLPVVVRAADGGALFEEGRDYTVGDEQLVLPPGSRIREGAGLAVSWHMRPQIYSTRIPASTCHPEYYAIHKQLVAGLDAAFGGPPGFMMRYAGGHNGWYLGNWDPACGEMKAGALIALTIRKSETLLRGVRASCELYLWNDIVDPFACAKPAYGLWRGSLEGAWEGVARSTLIVNRNPEHLTESLLFFARRRHEQIVACPARTDAISGRLHGLEAAEAAGATGIVGFMYGSGYETFEELAQGHGLEIAANRMRAVERWGERPAFPPPHAAARE